MKQSQLKKPIKKAKKRGFTKLGPIQKKWIAALRAHPERQMKGQLGKRTRKNSPYKACCLGEGGLVAGVCSWVDNVLYTNKEDYFPSKGSLENVYEALGLTDSTGTNVFNGSSLASLNDNGTTWAEIADMLEKNPKDWFVKSK